MYTSFFKRMIDIFVSTVLLCILFPFSILLVILIKSDSSGPVLYVQKRLGMGGRIFDLYKFRTMTNKNRVHHQQVFEGDPDITRVGSILRRLKIDEFPQLLNILIGDMTIVGPRPCLPDLINKFNDDGHSRLKVKPGVTGLAQVNGNIHLTWPERWQYDRYYVENISLMLDIRIVVKTFAIIIFGEGRFLKNKK